MAERITIEKIKALETEYEVTIPDEIKKLLCDGEIDRSRRKVHLKYGEWEDETFLHGLYSTENDVRTALDWLSEEWFPKGYIPFAYDEGGESFCVGVKPDNYGAIFLFMSDSIEDNPEDAMLFVSSDLSAFFNSLESEHAQDHINYTHV